MLHVHVVQIFCSEARICLQIECRVFLSDTNSSRIGFCCTDLLEWLDHMIAKSMLLSFKFHIYLDKKINLVLHRTFLRLANVFKCGILGSSTALLHTMSLESITGLLQCRSSSIWRTSFKMHWNSDIKVSENMIHDQGCWKCNSIYAELPKWFYDERHADSTSTSQPLVKFSDTNMSTCP